MCLWSKPKVDEDPPPYDVDIPSPTIHIGHWTTAGYGSSPPTSTHATHSITPESQRETSQLLRPGEKALELVGHKDAVSVTACSAHGTFLASGSQDCTIRIWETRSGSCTSILSGHLAAIRSLAFSKDGRFLISGSDDTTAILWYLSTGAALNTLDSHEAAVTSVAFSPDAELIATGGEDWTIILWEAATGACKLAINQLMNNPRSLCFSHDGLLLAASSSQGIVLFESSEGRIRSRFDRLTDEPGPLAFTLDGSMLACGERDGSMSIWTPRDEKLQCAFDNERNREIVALAFSICGKYIAAAESNIVALWRTTPELQWTLSGFLGTIDSVTITSSNRILVSGFSGNNALFWNLDLLR